MDGVSATLTRGFAWNGLASAVRVGSGAVMIIVLARLLEPRDFGLVQMSMPVVLLLMLVGELGLGAALVQTRAPSRSLWATAFWTNLAVGLGLAALVVGVAPLAAAFYREPDVAPILATLGALLLLQAATVVPYAKMQRQMRFAPLSLIEIGAAGSGLAAAIITALQGGGAWALVLQQVVAASIRAFGFLSLARVPIAAPLRWRQLANLAGFSANMVAAQIVNFLGRSLDNVLIGRVLGAGPLGYYALAYRMMLMPVQVFGWALASTLLPGLASIKDEPTRLKVGCLRVFSLVAFVTFPVMAGLSALAEPAVALLLGEKMEPAALPLALLAPVGALQALSGSHGAIYAAIGRADILFRWSAFANFVLLFSIGVGVQFGLAGAAAGYLIAYLLLFLPGNQILMRQIGGDVSELLRAIGPSALIAAGMGLCVWLVAGILARAGGSPVLQLVACVPIGALIYGAGAVIWQRGLLVQCLHVVQTLIPASLRGSSGP